MWKPFALALGLAAMSAAQAPPPPRFNVVSVKPSPDNEILRPLLNMPTQVGGFWRVNVATVTRLIIMAYQLRPDLIVGLPSWASSDRYDIEVRMPPETNVKQFHLMLQALLADRFQMRAHTEMRTTAVSVMTVDRSGPDLHPASGNCAPPGQSGPHPCGYLIPKFSPNSSELAGYSVSMADVATFFTAATGSAVVDETGLKGLYDIDVTTPMRAMEANESPDEYTADSDLAWRSSFRKSLGLDLDLTKTVKRPFPMLVIDHLAPASAN